MLTILSDSSESTVACTIAKISLQNPPDFDILSYCWGNASITTNTIVNSIIVPVTVNLAEALQRLRGLGISRLWVDALCINQQDRQEKSMQIRNMRSVYSKATVTYAWLGKGDNHQTIPFLKPLLDSRHSKLLVPTVHTCPLHQARPSSSLPVSDVPGCLGCSLEAKIRGVQQMLTCQYWRRRWIIQEISVSNRHMILYGEAEIPLNDLEKAIARCRTSCYWDSALRFSWFQKILEFRQAYHLTAGISLFVGVYHISSVTVVVRLLGS